MVLAHHQQPVRTGAFLVISLLLILVSSAPPAPFDRLQRLHLAGLVQSPAFKSMESASEADLAENDRWLAPGGAAFAIVRTRGGRFSKIRLNPGRLKVPNGDNEPMVFVEQFVTCKDGEEKAFVSRGENRAIFPGTEMDLDLGQVVPERIGGDLRCVKEDGKLFLRVRSGAKLWLAVDKVPLPASGGTAVPIVTDKFQQEYFRGKFQLHDDGRRSGSLSLDVKDGGEIVGKYFSDKDGTGYEVRGRLGPQPHQIEFGIRFPRTEQMYRGFLFTGNAQAIAGTSRMGDRETGFYAQRESP